MKRLLSVLIVTCLLLACSFAHAQSTPQASDNNVVVGDAAQPVQWFHKDSIKGAILAAQPNGTVWIPATYVGTDCNPISSCNPGSVLVIDMRNGQFNTTPTGSGTCGTCFSTIFGRSGPTLTANATDYGTAGIAQPNGSFGQTNILKQPNGTLSIGSGPYPSQGNWLYFEPDNDSGTQIFMQDYSGDQFTLSQIVGLPAGGIPNSSGITFNPTAGLNTDLGVNHTDFFLQVTGGPRYGRACFVYDCGEPRAKLLLEHHGWRRRRSRQPVNLQ